MGLSDAQWEILEPMFEESRRPTAKVVPGRMHGRFERGTLDPPKRSAVAGFAESVSTLSNMSSSFSAVAKRWTL